MNITSLVITTNDQRLTTREAKNKPNSNPIKPNLPKDGNAPTSLLLTTNDQRLTTRETQNKPNQTQLFSRIVSPSRVLPPKGRIVSPSRVLPPKGRIVSPSRVFVPKSTQKFHRSGAGPCGENGAEKGLTTPASSDSLKIKRWADKAVCLC